MTDDRKLPVPAEEPPVEATWLDDVDTHLIEVTRHDENDIIFGRQYFLLMLEDAESGRFLTTRVSSPVTTETDQN